MMEKLVAIIGEHTGRTDLHISRDTVLLSDLGMNSFELVSLACEIEDAFDVEIPDRAIKGFKTIGDVIDFIEYECI